LKENMKPKTRTEKQQERIRVYHIEECSEEINRMAGDSGIDEIDGIILDIVTPSVGEERGADGNRCQWGGVLDRFGEKVRQVHVRGRIEEALEIGSYLKSIRGEKGKKPVLKYFSREKEEIIRHSDTLKKQGWVVCPEFSIRKREDVTFITSMGVIADLLYRVDAMEETVLLDILNYYLHEPKVDIPVEPFHSILNAKLRRKTLNLWNLHLLLPGLFNHVRVDKTGKGALAEPGSVGGAKYYLDTLPQQQPQCMSCLHFHLCFGWGKYGEDSCEKWKKVLEILQRTSKELEQVVVSKKKNSGKSISNN
jgi:hypothetical protein